MRKSGSTSSKGDDSNIVPDFDLARTWKADSQPLSYYIFPLQRGDSDRLEYFAVPRHPDAPRDHAYTLLQRTVVHVANALEDIRDLWERHESGEGTEPANDAHEAISGASKVVVENLRAIVGTRFGSHTVAEITNTLVGKAIANLTAATRDGLGLEGIERLIREIDRRAATRILHAFLDSNPGPRPGLAEELASHFKRVGGARLGAERRLVMAEFAHGLAESILRQHQPGRIELAQLLDLVRAWSHGDVDPIAFDVTLLGSVHLPTDEALRRLARFVTDPRDSSEPAPLGLAESIERRSYHQHLKVRFDERLFAELVGPERAREVRDRILYEPSETRAKVLLALFALATHHELPERGTARIDLDYLMALVTGYHRSGPHRAKLERFNLKLAEVLRCTMIELPGLMISSRIKRSYEAEATLTDDVRLMAIPHLEAKQAFNHVDLFRHLAGAEAQPKATSAQHPAVQYLKGVHPTHITVVLSPDSMRAFGVDKGANEVVNADVYKLRGPSFWLAVQVAFERRWGRPAGPETQPGVPLLATLDKYGFTTRSVRRTGGRPSYKHALDAFLKAIEELVQMGELDDPGVTTWDAGKGHAPRRDVSPTLRKWVDDRGKRITIADLAPVRVAFVVNEGRRKQLEAMRKRRRQTSDDAGQ